MLSIGKLLPGRAEYYLGTVANGVEDYYTGAGEAPGQWVGTSAGRLGLSGEVDGFLVTTEGGRMYGARRVLVTGGVVDELPDVPGLAERWGIDVLHCPYCHGWEVGGHRRGRGRVSCPTPSRGSPTPSPT